MPTRGEPLYIIKRGPFWERQWFCSLLFFSPSLRWAELRRFAQAAVVFVDPTTTMKKAIRKQALSKRCSLCGRLAIVIERVAKIVQMISFEQLIANLELELQQTTKLSELRALVAALRTSVAVTPPPEGTDDQSSWARLLKFESFIETGSQIVAISRQMTNGFKSLATSQNKRLVATRLVNLRDELRLQMERVEQIRGGAGFGDWAALLLWRKLAQTAEEGVAHMLAPAATSSSASDNGP